MSQELIQHDKIGPLYIHRVTNWRFQDTASRMDVNNQFVQADLDKMCYDMETETYYILVSISAGVPTWYPIPSSFTPTGEANTASSAGGVSLVLPKSGVDLPFKGLVAGTNVTFDIDGTTVTINASLSGGPFAPLSHVGTGGAAHAAASGVAAGFMSAADYTLLHSLVSNANHTGDVTGSTVLTIANNAVTFAKFQAASGMKKLLGRGDSGAGNFEEIVLGTGLSMTGNTLSASSAGLGDMTKAVYDTDDDGVVDNSELLGGQDSAYHLSRANHTGTQVSTTISDFTEAVQDVVGATLVNGTNITITYNDVANTITISGTSFEPIIAVGTTGQYWRGDKTFQTLDKSAVGLGNVDNTSDATKNSAVATITNKVISGTANTITDIPESAVINLTSDLAAKQPLDATLTALAGTTTAADKLIYWTGVDTSSTTDFTTVARQLVDDTSFSAMRTTLGLGTIATQAASAVAITGGAIDGTTLGATTPSSAKVTSLDVSSDLTLSGTSKLFRSDFTSAPNLRTSIQTTTVNGTTFVNAIPNGTGAASTFLAYNGSDPLNASFISIRSNSSFNTITSSNNGTGAVIPLAISVNGADAINISTAQNVGFGVASPTTDCKLQVSNGISVGNSASAVATVFDYYQRGTFTPVVAGSTVAGTGTYTIQIGRYQRNGNRVSGQLTVAYSAHTGTGNFQISGLPFTSASGAGSSTLSVYRSGLPITAGNSIQPYINASSTGIQFDQVTAPGVASSVPMSSGSTTIVLNFSYEV